MTLHDEVFLADFDKHIKNLEEATEWFKQLYYNPRFSTIFEQTRLSIMITGFDFLLANLKELKTTYQLQTP